MPATTEQTYYASGDEVFHKPGASGMAFRVCTIDPYLITDDDTSGAAEVARLMNLGEGVKEAVAALKQLAERPSDYLSAEDWDAVLNAIAKLEG